MWAPSLCTTACDTAAHVCHLVHACAGLLAAPLQALLKGTLCACVTLCLCVYVYVLSSMCLCACAQDLEIIHSELRLKDIERLEGAAHTARAHTNTCSPSPSTAPRSDAGTAQRQ